jgi:hypothetical protein
MSVLRTKGKFDPTVVPMGITFMDTEDEYKKYGTLTLLRYMYSNSFRF